MSAAIGRLNARLATVKVTETDGASTYQTGEVIIDGQYNATVALTDDFLALRAAEGALDVVKVRVRVDEEVVDFAGGGSLDMPVQFARALRDALTEALGHG